MRFGQNVLRMTWKERFVQFSWKAHCFPVLKRVSGQCDDFDNFDAQKCDLAKTCCVSRKAHFFPVFKRIRDKSNDFEKFDPEKYDLGKTCCAWGEKRVFYNFHGKRTVFPFWGQFGASLTILRTLAQKCDLAKTCCAWPEKSVLYNFMESALFSRFEASFGPCDLAKTCCAWPQEGGFVQFSWKAHCLPFLERISGQCDDFDNFDAHKFDLAKTCCALPTTFMKSALFSRFEENLRQF